MLISQKEIDMSKAADLSWYCAGFCSRLWNLDTGLRFDDAIHHGQPVD